MKRQTLDVNKLNLLQTMKANVLGRNQMLRELATLIDSVDSSLSVVLDGDWGSGKTFLVKQLELLLSNIWQKKHDLDYDTETDSCIVADESLSKIQLSKNLIPVYFNAWKYDNQQDPILSILYEIIHENAELRNTTKVPSTILEKFLAIVDCLNFLTNGSFQDLREKIVGDNLLDSIAANMQIDNALRFLVDELLGTDGDKFVLIIDELDRCRPSYAVEVLERVKHFFDDDRFVVVYSANVTQLVHTVSHLYGMNFDASKYLNRFFDLTFTIETDNASYSAFMQSIGAVNSRYYVDKIPFLLARHFKLSLRDTCIYYQTISSVKGKLNNPDNTMLYLFVPLVKMLSLIDNTEYRRFIAGENNELIGKILDSSAEIYKCVDRITSQQYDIPADSGNEDEHKKQLYDLLDKIYRLTFADHQFSSVFIAENEDYKLDKNSIINY